MSKIQIGDAKVKCIDYRTWTEFKSSVLTELFGEHSFHRGVFIFRGQRSASWKLITSFDRLSQSYGFKNAAQLSHKLGRDFAKSCEGITEIPKEVWADEIKTLALGQHYGLPTRLLDWTDSPYLAAFFAFSVALAKNDQSVDRVGIWALDTRSPIWGNDNGVTIVDISSVGNVRLRNQSGKFTISRTPFECLEDYVNHFTDCGTVLYFFTIPFAEAKMAMDDLDLMQINHARVFADLSGHAESAKVRLILDNLP